MRSRHISLLLTLGLMASTVTPQRNVDASVPALSLLAVQAPSSTGAPVQPGKVVSTTTARGTVNTPKPGKWAFPYQDLNRVWCETPFGQKSSAGAPFYYHCAIRTVADTPTQVHFTYTTTKAIVVYEPEDDRGGFTSGSNLYGRIVTRTVTYTKEGNYFHVVDVILKPVKPNQIVIWQMSTQAFSESSLPDGDHLFLTGEAKMTTGDQDYIFPLGTAITISGRLPG